MHKKLLVSFKVSKVSILMEDPTPPPGGIDRGFVTTGADHVEGKKRKSTLLDTESNKAHRVASLQQLALQALPEGTPIDQYVYDSARSSYLPDYQLQRPDPISLKAKKRTYKRQRIRRFEDFTLEDRLETVGQVGLERFLAYFTSQ